MKSCDIIIVSYNAKKFLEKCIESIVKHTKIKYKIIIVDNNSNKETKDYLFGLKLRSDNLGFVTEILFQDKNYGFGMGNNKGIEYAMKNSDSEYICFLNSDIIVTENWLTKLTDALEETKAGIIGPFTNYVSSEQQKIEFDYFHDLDKKDDSKIQEFAKKIEEKHKNEILRSDRLVGFCFVTKKDYLKEVGNFDDRYEIGNFEDDDLCLRFIERGYSLYSAKNTFIYHYGGQSFKDEYKTQTYNEVLETNRKLHEQKWYQTKKIEKIYKEKKPLNIIYLMTSDGPSGGVKVIFEQANRLQARGHIVSIYCAIKEAKKSWFDVKVPIIYENFDNIPECDILIGTYFSNLPYLQKSIAKVKIHLCQGYEALYHEDKIMLEEIRTSFGIPKNRICVSSWIKDIVDSEYGTNSHLIGNGLDQYVFSFKKHKENKKPRVLVTGDDTLEIKGINFALEAIRDLVMDDKIELIRLSGSGQKLTDIVCEFYQMSKMSQDEIAKVYESCDITISPSLQVEGFNLHPLESMASGTPVITTDCGGNRDYIDNLINCLVVPEKDSKAIREALDKLLEDKKLYKRLRNQGIQTSRKWLWYEKIDKLEDTFYDLYEESLKTQVEQVSFCMIVKNEEEYLDRCLRSIKDIAAEIIIVDTGSIDNTIRIAKKYGAKIYHYEWNDDFSAARNFALSKVTQPWTFVLDADEIISKKDYDKFRELLRGEKIAYNFITRNYVNDRNVEKVITCKNDYEEEKSIFGWSPSVKIRLFPTNKEIKFEGKVHELIEKSVEKLNIPIKDSSFPVLHFGYLKNRSRKDEIYAKLGKAKLQENKNDLKAIYELALQYMALNNFDEALILWRKAIALKPDSYEFWGRMGTTYNLLENYDQAEKCFLKALSFQQSEYAYRHLGITYAKKSDYQKAYDCFKKIVPYTKDLKALGDYAFCCNYLRKFDESILILEKVSRYHRQLVVSWGLLEVAYNEKGIELARKEKFQQAISLFRCALDINSNFGPAKRNLKEVVRIMNSKTIKK